MTDLKEVIDEAFDFDCHTAEQCKHEMLKAQDLLNYVDHIRTFFGARIACKKIGHPSG